MNIKAKKIKIKQVKTNKLFVRLVFLISISILFGVFYMAILSKSNKNLVGEELKVFFSSLNKLSYTKAFIECFIKNSFLLTFVWLLGISIIGVPIIILILLFKSFLLGFSISSILFFYKWKGILIAVIYCFPLLINLFSFLFLGYYAIIFSKNLNRLLFLKKEISFRNIMRRYIKMLIFSLILILISSLVEIYVVPSLLSLLKI